MINLIDEDCNLKEDADFPTAGLTVCVLGTQGSGKSTLLNQVFGASFPTLAEKQERRRCTAGVWVQRVNNVTLVDTEGFDSTERGEEEKIFEKQMSVLCVVICDVILINLYMDEVGRYTGGHLDVLEAVFKVGEGLVTHRKKLVYVIRDCSREADQRILAAELGEQIKAISEQQGNKQLKYSVEFHFMSHFVYQPQSFALQAKQLLEKAKVGRPSGISSYHGGDQMRLIGEVWRQLKESKTEVDLKSIDDAIKTHVMERLQQQIVDKLTSSLDSLSTLAEVKSFRRFNQLLKRRILEQLRDNRPRHLRERDVALQGAQIFDRFEPTKNRHFNGIVLRNITEELMEEVEREVRRGGGKKWWHLMLKKKKEVGEVFKRAMEDHREYALLVKNFNERTTAIITREECRLSHLFSLFQGTVERELGLLLEKQAKQLLFGEKEVSDRIKDLCREHEYQEWEVDLGAIWEKVHYRCIDRIIPQVIHDHSMAVATPGLLTGDQTTSIIACHTALEKKALDFCRDISAFMQQDNNILLQPLSQVKDIVRQCLRQRLLQEQSRWKVSFFLVALLLFMLYGEFSTLLGYLPVRKRNKKLFLRLYYWTTLATLLLLLLKNLSQLRRRLFC